MVQERDSQLSTDVTEWIQAELEGRLRILGPATPIIHRWLLETAQKRYREFLDSQGHIFAAGLRTLHLDYQCSPEEISRIPRTGAAIVVANHPYRELEIPLLGAILADIRTDFRFLVTSTAMFNSMFREFFIPIERFPNGRANTANRGSIRAAVQWLRTGGLVVVFPAGAIATRPAPTFKLTEQPWSEIAAVLARWSGAIVVPIFVTGLTTGRSMPPVCCIQTCDTWPGSGINLGVSDAWCACRLEPRFSRKRSLNRLV